MPKTVATKPYDWTFTTTYPGHQVLELEAKKHSDSEDVNIPTSTAVSWTAADPENPSNSIPMAELSRPDPILFYAEIPLFEDELHDNGSSSVLVRIVSRGLQLYLLILLTQTSE